MAEYMDFSYEPPSQPSILSLSTNNGSSLGKTSITIEGDSFIGATFVNFGELQTTDFLVEDNNKISCLSPAGVNGYSVIISVTTNYGTGTSLNPEVARFTYNQPSKPFINSLSINTGSVTGNNSIIIKGRNFINATRVSFDSINAIFEILDDNTIMCSSPSITFLVLL
jgi:hypothetical protein